VKYVYVNTARSPRVSDHPAAGDHPGKEPVRALLFDMDNTLFDLVGAQMKACDAVMHELGMSGRSGLYPYFLRPVHGYEAHENILDFLQDCGIHGEGLYEHARRVYDKEKLRSITPYPGAAETLALLRGYGLPLGIITDAHTRDAVRRLEKTGLLPFFSCMVTYDLVRVKKPASAPFIAALGMLQSSAEEVMLVGDSPRRDIEPAKNLGFWTVYARYGDRFSAERSCVHADFVLDAITGLPDILSTLGCREDRQPDIPVSRL